MLFLGWPFSGRKKARIAPRLFLLSPVRHSLGVMPQSYGRLPQGARLGGHLLPEAMPRLLKVPFDLIPGLSEALLHQRRFLRIKAERRR